MANVMFNNFLITVTSIAVDALIEVVQTLESRYPEIIRRVYFINGTLLIVIIVFNN